MFTLCVSVRCFITLVNLKWKNINTTVFFYRELKSTINLLCKWILVLLVCGFLLDNLHNDHDFIAYFFYTFFINVIDLRSWSAVHIGYGYWFLQKDKMVYSTNHIEIRKYSFACFYYFVIFFILIMMDRHGVSGVQVCIYFLLKSYEVITLVE